MFDIIYDATNSVINQEKKKKKEWHCFDVNLVFVTVNIGFEK